MGLGESSFRSYYHGNYDALRLFYKRNFDRESLVVIQAEKKWSLKLNRVLIEERGVLERCEEEIIARRARVNHLEKVKADNLEEEISGELDCLLSQPGD